MQKNFQLVYPRYSQRFQMNKLLIVLLFVSSCASFSSSWSEWKLKSVPMNEKAWRFCRVELDGPTYSEKGMCFQDQECRYKKRFLQKKKKQCRNKTLFCKWGDIDCLKSNNIFFNIIINEGVTR